MQVSCRDFMFLLPPTIYMVEEVVAQLNWTIKVAAIDVCLDTICVCYSFKSCQRLVYSSFHKNRMPVIKSW